VNLYPEQDLKNQPLQLELSEEDRNMSHGGRHITGAYIHGTTHRLSCEILYRMSIPFQDGLFLILFSFIPASRQCLLPGRLTNVARTRDTSCKALWPNGRIFRWVAPENGVPQGSYKACQAGGTPKKSQSNG